MNANIYQEEVFDIVNWPVLALAAPICGVIAAVMTAGIAHRLLTAGFIGVPVMAAAFVSSMFIVALLVWHTPKGQIRLDASSVTLDRIEFFARQVDVAGADISLLRWNPGRTPIAQGVQLRVDDGQNTVLIGVASQSLVDELDEKSPASTNKRTSRMPHAQISVEDFRRLLQALEAVEAGKSDLSVSLAPAFVSTPGASHGTD